MAQRPLARFLFSLGLHHIHCLGNVHHPSYFDCVDVGELNYEIDQGLPFDCHSGVKVHVELPQLDCPFEEPV